MDSDNINTQELYPDIFTEIKQQISPHRLVMNNNNQPIIPDEHCTIVKWTDKDGEHIYRFLKDEYINKKVENNQISFDDVLLILKKNLNCTGMLMGILYDLNRSGFKPFIFSKPAIIVVIGPYCSGKSFIIDIIKAFLDKNKYMEIPTSILSQDLYEFAYTKVTQIVADANSSHSDPCLKDIDKKELLLFRDFTPTQQYKRSWNTLMYLARIVPVLVEIQDIYAEMIQEIDKCMVIRCKHIFNTQERNENLRNKDSIQQIANTIRNNLIK